MSVVDGAVSVPSDISETERFVAKAEQALLHHDSQDGDQQNAQLKLLLSSNTTIRGPQMPFVGRQAELALLQQAVKSVLGNRDHNQSHLDVAVADNKVDGIHGSDNMRIPRAISISGAAGSGKSSLVQKARSRSKKTTAEAGYFVYGKYSHQSSESGLATAMQELVDQIVAQDFDMSIRRRLTESISPSDAVVLVETFSALSDLLLADAHERLGTTTTTAAAAGDSSDNSNNKVQRAKRRRFLFQQFIKTVTSSQLYEDEDNLGNESEDNQQDEVEVEGMPPLGFVLVLDDVQWIDESSLELISSLVRESDVGSFLLVTTTRPLENTEHPFLQELTRWKGQGIPIHELQLENLDNTDVNLLVAQLLDAGADSTAQLAEVIHQKSLGNPFYTIEFLKGLVQRDLLSFNYSSLQWKWDHERVQATGMTTISLVELLTDRIKRISADHQLLLLVASCLGVVFEQSLIDTVLRHVRETDHDFLKIFVDNQRQCPATASSLEFCVESGFLSRNGTAFYFVHDLVKEAALEFCTKEEHRLLLQLEVGRCILKKVAGISEAIPTSTHLFLGVDLCNSSSSILVKRKTSRSEWIWLARCNLWAGQKSARESAFALAAKYMKTGLGYLDHHAVSEQGTVLWFSLLAGAAEASWCVGDFGLMKEHANRLLQYSCSESLQVEMMFFKISSAVTRMSMKEAVEVGLRAIDLLGIAKFPMKPNIAYVLAQLYKTKRLLWRHTRESLLSLPILTDEKRVTAMRIIDAIQTPSWSVSPNLLIILILKSVRWSVKYGISSYSPASFALYGAVLYAVFGDLKGSAMFGHVALGQAEGLDVKESIAKTSMMVFSQDRHMYSDMRICYAPILYAHKLAMESGDTETGFFCLMHLDIMAWCTSLFPLPAFSRHLERHSFKCQEHKHQSALFALITLSKSLRRLCGDNVDTFDWLDKLERCATQTNDDKPVEPGILAFCDTMALQSHYMLGEFGQALVFAERLEGVGTKLCPGQPFVIRCLFYRGLVFLAANSKGKRRRYNLRKARRVQALFRKWKASGNINCEHLLCLIDAEYSRETGNNQMAKDCYAEAIQVASRKVHTQDVAICHECAARFYLQVDNKPRAAYHTEEAVNAYRDWGALAKVDQLMEKDMKLLNEFGSTIFSLRSSMMTNRTSVATSLMR